MKFKILISICLLFTVGCVSEMEKMPDSSPPALSRLKVGMSKHQVEEVLSQQNKVFKQFKKTQCGYLDSEPYDKQTRNYGSKTVEIWFYRTRIYKSGTWGASTITDGKTISLTFDNNKLVNWQ